MTTRSELEALTRDGLIERARRLGVPRPEVMTRVEMVDEIIRRQETDATARRRARGWLGVARDLVASLIEQGLNMPDAAELVRQGVTPTRVQHQPPVATVTLAEIYAAQGHVKRALGMLDQVLDKEPDHAAARALRDRLAAARPTPVRAVEPEQPEDAPTTPEPLEPVAESEPEPTLLEAAAPAAEPAPAEPEPAPAEPAPLEAAAPAAEPAPVEPEPAPAEPAPARAEPGPTAAPAFAPAPHDDVLVLIPSARGVLVYWELSERSRAAALGGALALRLAAFSPSPRGAQKLEQTLALAAPAGTLLATGLGTGAVVRGVLGVARAEGFAPRVVASVMDAGALAFSPLGARAPDAIALERAKSAVASL